jgi:hypothetical protein
MITKKITNEKSTCAHPKQDIKVFKEVWLFELRAVQARVRNAWGNIRETTDIRDHEYGLLNDSMIRSLFGKGPHMFQFATQYQENIREGFVVLRTPLSCLWNCIDERVHSCESEKLSHGGPDHSSTVRKSIISL